MTLIVPLLKSLTFILVFDENILIQKKVNFLFYSAGVSVYSAILLRSVSESFGELMHSQLYSTSKTGISFCIVYSFHRFFSSQLLAQLFCVIQIPLFSNASRKSIKLVSLSHVLTGWGAHTLNSFFWLVRHIPVLFLFWIFTM